MRINVNLYYDKTKFLKERYLNNCRFEEPTREVIDMWFRQAAKIEAQEQCDLANFIRPQVYNLLKGLNLRSKHTLKVICVYFSDYYSWCISEGLIDSGNIVNQYDLKMVANIIDELVPVELVVDKYFKEETVLQYKEMIPDKVNQFILYALFSGVYGLEYDDLTHLRIDDINETRKAVHLNSGKIISVDDIFIELAKEANKQTKYYPEGVVEYAKRATDRKRYDYDPSYYIIKSCKGGTENLPVDSSVIMTRLRLMQKQTGNKFLNGVNLYRNGMINYITKKFAEQNVTFRQALLEKKGKREYQYGEEMQKYINEFGSNMTVRMLRLQIADYIELF
jgi:hypothetical protein